MFRKYLKEQIEYKGLLIKELAAKTGISKRTIDSYVDSRAVIPNAEIAVKLASVLDTTVEYLVTGKDKTIPKDFSKYMVFRDIFDDMLVLPDELLVFIKVMIHAAAEAERKKREEETASG